VDKKQGLTNASDKDTIDWSDPLKLQPYFKQLVALKKDNPALWGGEFGAMPVRINADSAIYAFKRIKENNKVIGIMNFSGKAQQLNITDKSVAGNYSDYFTGQAYELFTAKPLALEPWQYLIFVQK
jgi:maltooligosyltrehalose synthase